MAKKISVYEKYSMNIHGIFCFNPFKANNFLAAVQS